MYIRDFGLHNSLAISRERQGRFYWLELPLEVWLCLLEDPMRILLGSVAGIRRGAGSTLIIPQPSVRLRLRRHYSGGGFWQQVRYFLRPPAPPVGFVPPPRGEVMVSKLIGAVCFFWMFYIFRKDGATIFVSSIRPQSELTYVWIF